jgi:catechol 2,3-dioxygenase-like lactoylglutathione lyase family enzyme
MPLQAQPMIAVADVVASSRWYCRLLGAASGHGGSEYEQIVADGRLVLQLHAWDVHEHRSLGDPAQPRGNGVLLWFQLEAIDAALRAAAELGATVLQAPAVNPFARHREVWLRDPDGYVVVIAGRHGDTGDGR